MSDDLEPKAAIDICPSSVLAIPAALRRAGILRVVDNVPPGAYIGGFEKKFVRLFAPIIQSNLFLTSEHVRPTDAETDPDRPDGTHTA